MVKHVGLLNFDDCLLVVMALGSKNGRQSHFDFIVLKVVLTDNREHSLLVHVLSYVKLYHHLSEVIVLFVNKASLGWLDRAGDHNLFANHEVLSNSSQRDCKTS